MSVAVALLLAAFVCVDLILLLLLSAAAAYDGPLANTGTRLLLSLCVLAVFFALNAIVVDGIVRHFGL